MSRHHVNCSARFLNEQYVLTVMRLSNTHHHPVLRMNDVYRSPGLSLDGLVDDATGHAVNQNDANKASLQMKVCALRHHSKKVWVQVLQEKG